MDSKKYSISIGELRNLRGSRKLLSDRVGMPDTINVEEFWCTYDINPTANTRAEASDGKARTKVVCGNQRITIEDYVEQVYEERGFNIVRGDIFYMFLMICCGYFDFRGAERYSLDDQIRRNYHGDVGSHASIAHLYASIIEPNDENIAICKAGIRGDNYKILIKNASRIYNDPHRPETYLRDRDFQSFEKMLSFINSLEEHKINKLAKVLRQTPPDY